MATACHRAAPVPTFESVTSKTRGNAVARFLETPPGWVRRAVRVETGVELALGSAALLLIFGLVLFQAAQRYLPIEGWAGTGELARFALVWLTFLMAGVLVTTDSHIGIAVIDAWGSPLGLRVVRVVANLIVAGIGVLLFLEAWTLVDTQGILKSPAMRMPMSWVYGISMIGFASVVVRALVAALRYAVLGVPEPDEDAVLPPGAAVE